MNAERKRLLYDLPLIPVPQAGEIAATRSYPEVRVIWNGTLMEVIAVRGAVSIGHAEAADIVVDESVWDEPLHELIAVRDGVATLRLTRAMNGRIYTPKSSREVAAYLDEREETLELGPGCGAVLEFGPVTVAIRMTVREKVRPAPILEQVDTAALSLFALLFIIGLLLINAIVETPPIETDFVVVPIEGKFKPIPLDEVPVEEPEPVKKIILKRDNDGLHDAAQARKALGEEGSVGSKTSRVANAQGSSRKGLEDKVTRSSGIVGALTSGARAFDRIFGGGGLGAGLERTLGSVTGLSGVDQFGSGGLSTRGFGTGGGGNALAIGGFHTRGKGGDGSTVGYGMDKGRIGGKTLANIDAGGGQAVIMGALDRAVIDFYVRQNLARVRWCYEKELSRNAALFGKIAINFTISKSGQVSTSKVERSTMQSEPVETCVASVIKKIRFPSPKGGGIVVVTYPFVFKNVVN
ncbi:MAG TPA: AgmX/PglI C-terminal domain-containing protein [bacterium]|nr:AgmX/PglI C-terminal domain-containing protein [bacterium]